MLKNSHQLTRRERQIMDVLHRLENASARDVLDALPNPPSYSTVRALLARMVQRNLLTFHSEGKQYVYRPVEPRAQARLQATQHLVDTFFARSPVKAASALLGLEEQQITSDDIDELKALLNRLESRHRKQNS
ncbi:MAG: BlaI/MecI/CopY family transcriptional regulator [Pseudomonadota bacterium]